ncbi:MAG: PIN domain-containing protein [Pseudonocardiaceae bacterium]|nr:PIN domain-containing protein [Pseudonocardiaceae bacterium]
MRSVITAVDSNVVLDVLSADPAFGWASREVLRSCRTEGGLVACEVVWAEVRAAFSEAERFADVMDRLGIRFTPLQQEAASRCGETWRQYREHGGARDRVVADFLVGAHAALVADRLLTRDRGFFRSYFTDVTVLDPSRSIPPQRG